MSGRRFRVKTLFSNKGQVKELMVNFRKTYKDFKIKSELFINTGSEVLMILSKYLEKEERKTKKSRIYPLNNVVVGVCSLLNCYPR